MKIWIDFTNTPHVNFFLPFIKHFGVHHEFTVTARDFSETLPMLEKNNIDYKVIGAHSGKNKFRKVIGLATRIGQLGFQVPRFDISVSIGGQNTTPVSYFRRKPSIVFSDNDTSYKFHSYKLGSHFVFPSYFNTDVLISKYGIKNEQLHIYNGFKEDIYIADYLPNSKFLTHLPFNDFITIRPENLKASYVPTNAQTIVPELFEIFNSENILYLPRYHSERDFAKGYKNIYIPETPLSGLDVCYFTKAMLTGAGSFAREAAILGTPSVSFFPGKEFLTVDKIMKDKGWEFQSRDPNKIFEFVQSAKKRPNQIARSQKVQEDFFSIINEIFRLHT
jgi:uncharacterized protein